MAFNIKFADFVLEDVQTWQARRNNKVTHISLPRRHGTLIPDVAFSDEMVINVQGQVIKNSEIELIEYVDDLYATLMNFGKDRLYLRDNGRFVYAICGGTSLDYRADRIPQLSGGFGIEFIAGDPFWYSATEGSDSQIVGTTSHSWAITNNGKVRTPVRVHIHADVSNATDVKVTNTTTGLFMRYRGQVVTAQTVIMDGERYSCENNGANDLNNFEGSFFLLEVGVNNLTYSGPAFVTIETYWRERYIN